MNIKMYVNELLEKTFKELNFDLLFAKVAFSDKDGVDLQCNASFSLSKTLKCSPIIIASQIVDKFYSLSSDFELTVCNGFINFKIKDEFLSKISTDALNSERLNIPKIKKPISLIIDYGGANVAKPLHIGHMRSAIIGQALYRLNKFMGNTVVSDVHLGDWGLQMGLTIAQLIDSYDMGYYFGENKPKVEITVEMLAVLYPMASQRKTDDKFAQRASDITLWLQQKVKGFYDIWQELRKVSVEMVKKSYANFGVEFDLWNGESSVNDLANSIIEDMKKTGLIHESDGAFIMDIEKDSDNEPMPPAIIQKHNGAQMYIVTDVATILDRVNNYKNLNKILYVTDNRQTLHFKQVFRVVRKANFCNDNLELSHITFGTVNGTDGKPFKTRDGGTIKLDDVVDLVTKKALEKLKDNGLETDNELAKKIGISALLFGDMINIISKDYVFDIDKFCSFDGKTGPYLQYTAVRIKSILRKADAKFSNIKIDEPLTRNIIISMLKFIDSFSIAYKDNSLNSICQTSFDLASAFSTFYNDVKILKEENEEKKQNYLSICGLVLKALTLGLKIIGIEIPEYM